MNKFSRFSEENKENMSQEFWEMITLNIEPYSGTKICGLNNGDVKRIIVESNCQYKMYIQLWCDYNTEQSAEINPYGVGGFLVPEHYRHDQVQIGTSIDNENWHWTHHDYAYGGTK